MTTQRWWWPTGMVALLAAVALIGVIVLDAGARSSRRPARKSVRGALHATGADANAEGTFEENIEDGLPDSGGESAGEMTVRAANLAPRSRFTVNAAGTPVANFRTNGAGEGKVRVKGKKLAVDPRGQRLSVTDSNGDEVLAGEVGDPTAPGAIRCCLATADEQGCSDLLPAECASAGGADLGAGSCDPDPCPNAEPNDGTNDGGSVSDGDGDGETNDDGSASDGDGETNDGAGTGAARTPKRTGRGR